MSKKKNFVREMRRLRRRWFPTKREKEDRRRFTDMVKLYGSDAGKDAYYASLLSK